MIRSNETSVTGTTTDQATAPEGPTSGSAATARPDDHRGHVKPPATASPSPAPDSLKTPTGGAAANKPSKRDSSPKAPSTAAAAEEGKGKHDYNNPNSSGVKKRGSDPRGERGEKNKKRGGDRGVPRKRGSGARGVVAVEEADGGAEGGDRAGKEAGSGVPPEKVPRFSMQVRGHPG